MIVIDKFADHHAVTLDRIELSFESRCRSRFRARSVGGRDCGVFLERGTVLRGGDKLTGPDGTVFEVVAAPEALTEARSSNPLLIAKAAYHLGNRHVAVQLMPDRLRFIDDAVLGEMVRGLGLEVVKTTTAFEPESGAYGSHGGHAHPHGHSSDGEGRGPRIHDHFHGQ
ncbi:MAG: urease accessory protein UreE [Quisquiliibacterium sp.]